MKKEHLMSDEEIIKAFGLLSIRPTGCFTGGEPSFMDR